MDGERNEVFTPHSRHCRNDDPTVFLSGCFFFFKYTAHHRDLPSSPTPPSPNLPASNPDAQSDPSHGAPADAQDDAPASTPTESADENQVSPSAAAPAQSQPTPAYTDAPEAKIGRAHV